MAPGACVLPDKTTPWAGPSLTLSSHCHSRWPGLGSQRAGLSPQASFCFQEPPLTNSDPSKGSRSGVRTTGLQGPGCGREQGSRAEGTEGPRVK